MYQKMLNADIYQKIEWIFVVAWNQSDGKLGHPETVSQDTISRENIITVNAVVKPIPNNMPEIVKKVPWLPSKGPEQIDDRGARKPNYLLEGNKKGKTKIEWTGKDLNHVSEVYFDLIQTQEQLKKRMARMKHTAKKKVRYDSRHSRVGPPSREIQSGKVPQMRFVTKPLRKGGVVVEPSGTMLIKKSCHYQPRTRVLMEIQHFQKSTELLIQKRPFYQLVMEVLQAEKSWFIIQASAVMALHETSEAYLIHLLEDSHICTIHVKRITIMPKDIYLTKQIHGELWEDCQDYILIFNTMSFMSLYNFHHGITFIILHHTSFINIVDLCGSRQVWLYETSVCNIVCMFVNNFLLLRRPSFICKLKLLMQCTCYEDIS